ncbi:MAG: hypothetical protein AB7O98_02570 [Hyphomonadaceae bacterium]
MSELAEDRWGVRLFIRSRLEFVSGRGPRTDEEVRTRANAFSERIKLTLRGNFPRAEVEVRVPMARYGSASTAHYAKLLFDSPTPWIECRDALSSFVDDWQEMMEAEWALQEGDDLVSARVSVSVSDTDHHIWGLPPMPPVRGTRTAKESVDKSDSIMRAIRLRERMMWTFLGLGLAIGSLSGAALVLYSDVRKDLDQMRQQPVSERAMGATAAPIVVSYPPYPPPAPVIREREERCDDCPVIRRVP